ncbi:hypothetical protein PV783_22255 [Chitinophaga sp. CC14]|uniref:hypothetical protein n=1 Tax=Chitinophaga sp. CC14 TaxID=3029199 RepID=UPI003B7C01DB
MKLYSKSVVALLLLLNIYLHANGSTFPDTTGVLIINKEDVLPDGARKIGKIKVTDGVFKVDCGYEQTLEQAKSQAIKAGGNIIKIREIKPPDVFNSCYRLSGEVYYHPDIAGVMTGRIKAFDSMMRILLPETVTYALLYVYRPDMGSSIPYNVFLDDSIICRIRNSSRYLIKVNKAGLARISARTESRDEVSINIQPGKAYFVKCSIAPGGFIGRPKLSIIEAYEGFQEFNSVKEKPKEEKIDAVY